MSHCVFLDKADGSQEHLTAKLQDVAVGSIFLPIGNQQLEISNHSCWLFQHLTAL
jgi:hypothetical protein